MPSWSAPRNGGPLVDAPRGDSRRHRRPARRARRRSAPDGWLVFSGAGADGRASGTAGGGQPRETSRASPARGKRSLTRSLRQPEARAGFAGKLVRYSIAQAIACCAATSTRSDRSACAPESSDLRFLRACGGTADAAAQTRRSRARKRGRRHPQLHSVARGEGVAFDVLACFTRRCATFALGTTQVADPGDSLEPWSPITR